MKRTTQLTGALLALLLVSATSGLAGPAGATDGAFQIRLGAFFPDGDSTLWNENEQVFTLDTSDFNDLTLGFTYVNSINNSVELGVNLDFYDETVLSQYREFVDQDGFPIFHDTLLESVPLSLDLRFIPGGRYRIRPRGRHVLKPVFYVGAGVGVNFWQYEEVGDFIDFADVDMPVSPARFKDSGTTSEAHALAGAEFPMGPRTSLMFEGRYIWSDDDLGGDFGGLGKIDLGGLSVSVGGSFRF